jgi:hypothetical protein
MRFRWRFHFEFSACFGTPLSFKRSRLTSPHAGSEGLVKRILTVAWYSRNFFIN